MCDTADLRSVVGSVITTQEAHEQVERQRRLLGVRPCADSSPVRSAWLLCGHRVEAEDLVQETLAKVYVRMRRSVGSRLEKPAAYEQTTLTRTFISGRRKRSSSEVRYGDLPVGVVGDHAYAADLGAWRLGVEPQVHRQRRVLHGC